MYDLIVHFKGFNDLFKFRTNIEGEKSIETTIHKVSSEFKKKIIDKLGIGVGIGVGNVNKKLLMVWDGDDLGKFQWTQIMLATLDKLSDLDTLEIQLLCCYDSDDSEGKYGNKIPPHKRDDVHIDKLKNNKLLDNTIAFTYENINSLLDNKKLDLKTSLTKSEKDKFKQITIKDYSVVGMALLYITSKILSRNKEPILILCSGGGQIPVDEYEFTQGLKQNVIGIKTKIEPKDFEWIMSKNRYVTKRYKEKKDNKSGNINYIKEDSLLKQILDKKHTIGKRKIKSKSKSKIRVKNKPIRKKTLKK